MGSLLSKPIKTALHQNEFQLGSSKRLRCQPFRTASEVRIVQNVQGMLLKLRHFLALQQNSKLSNIYERLNQEALPLPSTHH